ncbi:MAG: Kae1-associated kinase Bud32 [Candidatus Bathyarchaeia archaeon]
MLIKKGAEANLYLEEWHGRKVILKRRLPKGYRLPTLDSEVRSQRTVHEPQIIHEAKEAGVPTPTVYMVDVANATIIMEFVEGKQVKEILNSLPREERLRLCRHIGNLIGRLHGHSIVHGDLTTSNMILTPHSRVIFLDFGLSERSKSLEARGVDLHLMKRALQSTHFTYAKECFSEVMAGYAEALSEAEAEKVLEKIKEIEQRGRYIER